MCRSDPGAADGAGLFVVVCRSDPGAADGSGLLVASAVTAEDVLCCVERVSRHTAVCADVTHTEQSEVSSTAGS